MTFEYSSSDCVDERCTSDGMLSNGFLVENDTSVANESNIRICCWNVVREDSESICSVLRFDGNKPWYVLPDVSKAIAVTDPFSNDGVEFING